MRSTFPRSAPRISRCSARSFRSPPSSVGFELEMELAPLMVFFRYDDVPGVIGLVGTVFGEAGVNIANMAVSRSRRGGKALMALSLDVEPPAELVEAVREQGFDDARLISLG